MHAKGEVSFRDFRDPYPEQVETLTIHKLYSALAVDVPSQQVLLDEVARPFGTSMAFPLRFVPQRQR